MQTSQDARFYAMSRKFDSFTNKDKPLVLQFSVKHEQNIDCGGGYLKVFDCSLDQKNMHGESPYLLMFGPDICGPGTKKVHVIFNYKGQNHLINKDIRCKDDVFTHFYTLIVKPDNTYEVLIDNEKVESGNMEEDWNFLPPKKIKDPEAKKPEDWDDRVSIFKFIGQILLCRNFVISKNYFFIVLYLRMNRQQFQTQMILNQKIGTSHNIFQTQKPPDQTIGTMKSTANGNQHKLKIQNTKANGHQNKSIIQPTKVYGNIQKLIIQNTRQTMNCTCIRKCAPLVWTCGK